MKRWVYKDVNVEITWREVICSVAIAVVMIVLGAVISSKISQNEEDELYKYKTASQINSEDDFTLALNTDRGKSLIYGNITANNPVTYDEIDGEYMYIKQDTEKYTEHTRMVKVGKTFTTQVYWTWDWVSSDKKMSTTINLLGTAFPIEKINLIDAYYLDTVEYDYHLRHVYYVVDKRLTGSVYTNIKNGTISDNSNFYKNKTANQVIESKEKSSVWAIRLFWLAWIAFTVLIIALFVALENNWMY